jgi:hypothetical protein
MTWFDVVILIGVVAILLLEMRHEAGRSMLDAVAALLALNVSAHATPALTEAFGWKPLEGTSASPGAFALCFAVLLAAGLLISTVLHRRTRWSMEHYDVAFSTVFGLVVAVTLGHVVTDVTARQALMRHGKLPSYIQGSLVAEELRSFRTYHYVVNTFEDVRYRNN